jgi:hypothetical protein
MTPAEAEKRHAVSKAVLREGDECPSCRTGTVAHAIGADNKPWLICSYCQKAWALNTRVRTVEPDLVQVMKDGTTRQLSGAEIKKRGEQIGRHPLMDLFTEPDPSQRGAPRNPGSESWSKKMRRQEKEADRDAYEIRMAALEKEADRRAKDLLDIERENRRELSEMEAQERKADERRESSSS